MDVEGTIEFLLANQASQDARLSKLMESQAELMKSQEAQGRRIDKLVGVQEGMQRTLRQGEALLVQMAFKIGKLSRENERRFKATDERINKLGDKIDALLVRMRTNGNRPLRIQNGRFPRRFLPSPGRDRSPAGEDQETAR